MRQISLGLVQYTQDYDEFFSMERIPNEQNAVGGWTWRYSVQPYIKSVQIYQCPSNQYSKIQAEGDLDRQLGVKIGYGHNGNIFNTGASVSIASVTRTSGVMLILESRQEWPDLGDWTANWTSSAGKGDFNTHTGSIGNWGFFDGHAKSMTQHAMVGSGSTSGWRDEEPPYGNDGWIADFNNRLNQVDEYKQ